MKRLFKYLEPVECTATIGEDDKNNFCVTVNPDQNRSGDCYLKYFNSKRYASADKVIRISLTKPRVFIHKNYYVKKTWFINSKDKKNLVNFLFSNSKDYKGLSNWQVTLYQWNNEMRLLKNDFPDKYNSRIEAFADGYFDIAECSYDLSYVPSTLAIPDYSKIRM